MRQLTERLPLLLSVSISKLPMRQLTRAVSLWRRVQISKLPMRQLTSADGDRTGGIGF